MGSHPFDIRHFPHPVGITHRPKRSLTNQPTVIHARKLVLITSKNPSIWLVLVKLMPGVHIGEGEGFIVPRERHFNIRNEMR